MWIGKLEVEKLRKPIDPEKRQTCEMGIRYNVPEFPGPHTVKSYISVSRDYAELHDEMNE
jgi:hypothetical protein